MNQLRSLTCCFAALLATAAGWGVVGICAGAENAPPPAWELWPYRVQVLVAVGEGRLIPAQFKDELPQTLQARLPAFVGGTWKTDVTAAPAELATALLSDIDAVQPGELPAVDEFDKVILLAVLDEGGRLAVRARELDLATGLWNATITIPAGQREYAAHAAVRAVLTAFAPLARIEECDGQTAALRLRASGLVPSNTKVLLAPETAFRPVLIQSEATGAIVRGTAELIEQTYLSAKDAAGRTVTCTLQTEFSGEVIPAYHPLRQRWALAVSRSTSPTRLRLVSREPDVQPIEGLTVVAEEERPVVIGQSDRRGEVVVPPGTRSVRTIVVRQGEQVLSRLSLVPGLERELTLSVDYDPRVVEFEAMIAQLTDDLVDAVARRAVAAAGQGDAAATLNPQVGSSRTAESLLARLDRLQQSVQSAAPLSRRRLEPRLAELRKGIEQLKPAAN